MFTQHPAEPLSSAGFSEFNGVLTICPVTAPPGPGLRGARGLLGLAPGEKTAGPQPPTPRCPIALRREDSEPRPASPLPTSLRRQAPSPPPTPRTTRPHRAPRARAEAILGLWCGEVTGLHEHHHPGSQTVILVPSLEGFCANNLLRACSWERPGSKC